MTEPPRANTSTPHCAVCGYELSGLGALTVCPECGAAGPPIELVAPGERYRSHTRFWRGALIVYAVYAVLFVVPAWLLTDLDRAETLAAGPIAALVVLLPYLLAALVLGTLARPRPGMARSLQLGLATTVFAHIVLLLPLFASPPIGFALMVLFSWLFAGVSLVAAREPRRRRGADQPASR